MRRRCLGVEKPGGRRRPDKAAIAGLAILLSLTAVAGWAEDQVPILQMWTGDYPVSELKRLPEGQQETPVGCIGDEETFAAVWQAWKPGEKTPEVDFGANLAVFSRNVAFYNRTSIFKATLRDGMLEVLAVETRSSTPVEDKVAMSMAVLPRKGVQSIRSGEGRIPVPSLGK
jgi:hypothetical protein